MHVKKKTVLCVAGSLLGGGILCGIAYADIIPGIDEPYNPPAYYSETALDFEDSPSPFTLKDMRRQGGAVYDKTRDIKSTIFAGKFTDWLTILGDMLGLKLKNTISLDSVVLHDMFSRIQALQANTPSMDTSSDILQTMKSSIFRSPERYDDESNSYDSARQLKQMEKLYTLSADAAKANMDELEASEGTLSEIMKNADQAEGEVQSRQAAAQMDALQQSETARRNTLLSDISSIRAMRYREQADEDISFYRQVQQAQLAIEDPYRPAKQDNSKYTKDTPAGFFEIK